VAGAAVAARSSSRQLSVRIGGREHLTAEAWTTLGGLVNVFPVVVWARPNESGDIYQARVEARTLDGRVCGEMRQLIDTLETVRPETDWQQHARDLIGVPSHQLRRGGADALIDQLRKELEEKR
jgi:hypothetical protein